MPRTSRPYRGHRLNTIFEIARILATQHDMEVMLPGFLSSLIATFPAADAGLVMLYDAGESCLRAAASRGYNAEALARLRLAPGESVSGRVFATGQAALLTGAASVAAAMATLSPANRQAYVEATAGLEQPQSMVCVPLGSRQPPAGRAAAAAAPQPRPVHPRRSDLPHPRGRPDRPGL